MKKIIAALIIIASLFTVPTIAFMEGTNPNVTVTLNGQALEFDVNPFIENDRTLVPMRKMFEAVGATVAWDDETKTVIASRIKNEVPTFVAIQVDTTTAFINSQEKKLEVPAKIVDDRTFVPLRFVIEALGETVTWDQDTYTVVITTK